MVGGRNEDAPARLSSRAGLVATSAALGLLVLVWAVTSGGPIAHRPRRDWDPPTPPQAATTTSESATSATPPSGSAGGAGGTPLGSLVAALFTAAVVIALIALTVAVGRAVLAALRGRRLRRSRALHDPVPPVAEAVAESRHAQHAALLEGAPSNAIVACWVQLEQSVADAGVHRAPSETSAELTLRVLDDLDTDREALRILAGLYREARYSQHPLTEDHRRRAQDALDRIHAHLPSRAGRR
ncbi:DUF4129 domain-containing protein [Luteipulveratus halotolerans]|uniref:DUF4129 domain-containing protein n=1 Tax=Luteipulveratus halotolerans TaxID=1631356 RepID=UPI0006827A27|nr:DUF4129 domain-containing protein [Luteipulveratus halotolerans]